QAQSKNSRNLILPLADPLYAQPCSDICFLGWVSKDTQLPLAHPFRPEINPVSIPWQKPTCAIALFRSRPEVFEQESIELPPQWWGDLFMPVHANIRITARMLVPYPDALEAARIMQAAAR